MDAFNNRAWSEYGVWFYRWKYFSSRWWRNVDVARHRLDWRVAPEEKTDCVIGCKIIKIRAGNNFPALIVLPQVVANIAFHYTDFCSHAGLKNFTLSFYTAKLIWDRPIGKQSWWWRHSGEAVAVESNQFVAGSGCLPHRFDSINWQPDTPSPKKIKKVLHSLLGFDIFRKISEYDGVKTI